MDDSQDKKRARIVETSAVPSDGCKWVGLKKLKYVDERGVERPWEMAERKTRKGEIDGVMIVAKLVSKTTDKPAMIPLISQFRPPCEGLMLELPAGLIDEGETAEVAAIRELKEECGYKGVATMVSPVVFCDPGFTNGALKYVFVECDLDDPENQNPQHQQEEQECITTHLVSLSDLADILENPAKLNPEIRKVDARLYAIGLGLSIQASI